MSKDILKKVLKGFDFSLTDERIEELYSEEVTDEQINSFITEVQVGAQEYSKPFVEEKIKESFNTERKSLKKKYFQDAARQVNKEFGQALTNKEVDDILQDPANEGKSFQSVLSQVKELAIKQSGSSDSEVKEMLDKANLTIAEKEEALAAKEGEIEALNGRTDSEIAAFKTQYKTQKLFKSAIMSKLKSLTDRDADIISDDFIAINSSKFTPKLEGDKIELMDGKNPEKYYKKSDTETYKLDELLEEHVEKRGLKPKSKGEPAPIPQGGQGGQGVQVQTGRTVNAAAAAAAS